MSGTPPAFECSGGGRGTGERPTTTRDLLAQGVCLEHLVCASLRVVLRLEVSVDAYRQAFDEALV